MGTMLSNKLRDYGRSIYTLFGDRRKRERIPFDCPVTVSCKDRYGQINSHQGTCINVSERGMAIETAEAIMPNTDIYIHSETHNLKKFARVSYCVPKGERSLIGCRFQPDARILELAAARPSETSRPHPDAKVGGAFRYDGSYDSQPAGAAAQAADSRREESDRRRIRQRRRRQDHRLGEPRHRPRRARLQSRPDGCRRLRSQRAPDDGHQPHARWPMASASSRSNSTA